MCAALHNLVLRPTAQCTFEVIGAISRPSLLGWEETRIPPPLSRERREVLPEKDNLNVLNRLSADEAELKLVELVLHRSGSQTDSQCASRKLQRAHKFGRAGWAIALSV